MLEQKLGELDIIEELRLRRWARENYVPEEARRRDWHPVILDEMAQKDRERRARETPTSLPA
ncbi:MAG: hypothetical protein C4297_02785 [Gemmataceae bacterium]